MPRPVDGSSSRYVPGLDGVRALAVLAVMGYHLGVPHMGGGLLGVSVFFTLSGFLITGILLHSWQATGGLQLGRFYQRRARRLLPALAVVLLAVLLVTAVAQPESLAQQSRDALGAALYLSNWQTIAAGTSYFDLFTGPQPLGHLWSLAIEEQFYLVWPLLLLVLLRRGGTKVAVWATAGLATASFVWMAMSAHPGLDHTRVYEGTDTRAGELLVGALLALLVTTDSGVRPAVSGTNLRRIGVEGVGLAGLAAFGVLVVTTSDYSFSLFQGLLAVQALASAALVWAVSTPGSWIGLLLGCQPLRWIGERSYGLYLWHMPVVAFIPQSVVESYSVPLAVFQAALTFVLAALSWKLVEEPIRSGGFQVAFGSRAPHRLVGVALVGALSVGTLSVAHAVVQPAAPASVMQLMEAPPVPDATDLEPTSPGKVPDDDAADATTVPGTTSCSSVVHVGDSTSIGLASEAYLPRAGERVDAQYREVGVKRVGLDISGARSIVETYEGQPNAYEATKRRMDAGYVGCWVFAMGTNDTANVFVGGTVTMTERIARIMGAARGRPAMWVTVKSRLKSGPWAESQMLKWNDALKAACRRYPNLRVYDWASEVQDEWFISDGIHFTTPGYRQRAHRIARSLAVAFPSDGQSSESCFVVPE